MNVPKMKVRIIVNEFNTKQIAALIRASLEIAKILKNEYDVKILSSYHKINNEAIINKEVEGITVKFYPSSNFYKSINKDYFENNNKEDHIFIFFQNLLGMVRTSYIIKNWKKSKLIFFLFSSKANLRDLLTFKASDILKSTKRLIIHILFSGFFIPDIVIRRTIIRLNVSLIFCQSKLSTNKMKEVCEKILGKVNIIFFRPPALFEGLSETMKENSECHREQFNISKNDFVILHSGLGSLLRGVDYVVEIFEEVKKRNNKKNIKLFIAIFHTNKSGTNRKYIENLKNRLKNKYPEDVIFIDYPYREIEKIYSCADLAIFPYRLYTDIPDCPLTVVELEKLKVPVLVTNIGPIGEYIPNEKFIIDYNIKSDTEKIIKLINNHDHYKNLKDEVSRFNKESFIAMQKNIDNFKKLIEKYYVDERIF